MSKLIQTVFVAAFVCGGVSAQTSAWQPSPGHTQVPLWPGAVPDSTPVAGPETMGTNTKDLIAGRLWVHVDAVSQPTMTVYSPKGKNTGAAIVVFPGGGYWLLAIDVEGTEVCDWLTSKGISALTPRSGISRLGCSGFPQADIYQLRSARILTSACTRLSMPPTRKAAARILRWRFFRDICLKTPLKSLN